MLKAKTRSFISNCGRERKITLAELADYAESLPRETIIDVNSYYW